MPKSNFLVELVNAFNLNNYFSDNVYTNFTVEGKKIVGLFAYGTDVTKYLRGVGEEIIKQQYSSREVAGKHYNLDCFPFVLGANPRKKKSNVHNVVEVELADSINREVIRNLKMHLVNEFDRAVGLKVIARLVEEAGITEEEGHEWVRGAVRIGAFNEFNLLKKDYLYCIAFDGEYFEREGYDSETFELFKEMYIQEFNSRLEECGLKNLDFYHYNDDMLYIKDVDEKVVKHVAKYVRGRVAFDFRTPGEEDSKVENFKDVLRSLISKWAGKSIDGYDYDVFTNEKEIRNGNSFVLIPLTEMGGGQFESLKYRDAYAINIIHKGFIRDIRGETEKLYITHCKNPVYAISNKGIAKLLPEIMQSPIAYNERAGHFEFAADLGPSSKLDSESPRQGSVLPSSVSKGTTGVAVPGVVDTKNNPGPSMSDQDQDDGYGSLPNSSQSVDVIKNSKRLSTSRESVGSGASGVDSKSENRLLRSESNLSDASTSTSIEDAEVCRPFSRSSSRRESRESYRNSM